MSTKEARPSAPSRPTKPPVLSPQLWNEGEEKHEEVVQGGQEPNSPSRSSSEESEEESDAEMPPLYTARRKVSFADAFGLDLVSIKEFDIGANSGSGSPAGLPRAGSRDGERYHLFHLFTMPGSNEELISRLRQNKLELESVEFLPDTTTISGVVRVLNLSYHKAVFVRVTLDGWGSHFDLLADYVPGSSDGETDRFSFRFMLMPPFRAEGARVEFCLRYESSTGTFWANNAGANYVLFCHCRGWREMREKEGEREKETEENNHKGKKSCLKMVRKWKPADTSGERSEAESPKPAASEGGKAPCESESHPRQAPEESRKALAERRSRRRAARLAHIQAHFSQRQAQLDHTSHSGTDEAGLKVPLPAPQLCAPVRPDASNEIQVSSNKKNGDAAPTRTYRQSALLSLYCGKHTTSPAHPHVSEISTGASPVVCKEQLLEDGSGVSCDEAWEAFLNGTDHSDDRASTAGREGSLGASPPPSHAEHDPSAPGDEAPCGWGATRDAQDSVLTGSQPGLLGAVSLESDPTAEWSDCSKHARDGVLDYEFASKPVLTHERNTGQEWEPASEQRGSISRSGATAPSDSHPSWEMPFGEDGSLLATNPGQAVRTYGGTGPGNFKAEGGDFKEEGKEEKVKRDMHGAASDDLTFSGVRDMLFPGGHAERGGAFQKQHPDEEEEPKQEKEHIREENDNTAPAKEKTESAHSESDAEALDRRGLAGNKKPTDPQVQSTETSVVSVSERQVLDKEELDSQTESLDLEVSKPQGEEEAGCLGLLKELLADTSEKPEAPSVEIETADWNCESSNPKAESQEESDVIEVTHGSDREGNVSIDSLLGEGHCSTTTTDTHEPPLAPTSHTTSGPSGPAGWTESAHESDPLLLPASNQGFECPGETLSCRAAQDHHEPDREGARLVPSPRTAAPSVGKILLVFCSLGFVSRALVYTALVLVVIAAYLHDLPVCLAIYLLSVCWWCGQGMKKQVATADSVD